jgi:hypothetical protein
MMSLMEGFVQQGRARLESDSTTRAAAEEQRKTHEQLALVKAQQLVLRVLFCKRQRHVVLPVVISSFYRLCPGRSDASLKLTLAINSIVADPALQVELPVVIDAIESGTPLHFDPLLIGDERVKKIAGLEAYE